MLNSLAAKQIRSEDKLSQVGAIKLQTGLPLFRPMWASSVQCRHWSRHMANTAISALIFEGKFPILEARFISEQSRPSARPGRENGCACRSVQRPSDQASLCSMPGSLRGLASRFFFFACNETVQKCLSESVLCLQKCALRFFYMHGMCW